MIIQAGLGFLGILKSTWAFLSWTKKRLISSAEHSAEQNRLCNCMKVTLKTRKNILVKRLYWNEKVSTDLQFSFLFCVRDALFFNDNEKDVQRSRWRHLFGLSVRDVSEDTTLNIAFVRIYRHATRASCAMKLAAAIVAFKNFLGNTERLCAK